MATEVASQLQVADVPVAAPHPVGKSAGRVWSALWPKLGAVLVAVAVWQLIVWSGWRPQSALPGPWPVVERLAGELCPGEFFAGMWLNLCCSRPCYTLVLKVCP